MAWIRLSDDYTDHPKFDSLSDGAFRLWHQAMGFCRKFQTDGLIPTLSVRKFKAYSSKRQRELMTPWQPGENPLWCVAPGGGVQVHHYLQWNLSKADEQAERDGAAQRMRDYRQRQHANGSSYGVTDGVTNGARDGDVPGRVRNGTDQIKEKGSDEKVRPLVSGARSKRPIFTGQRLTVFEWMLDDLAKLLGKQLEPFDVHAWFFELDARAATADLVIPQRDGGAWLLSETLREAHRRGLPIASASIQNFGKLTTRLAAALAEIRAEDPA